SAGTRASVASILLAPGYAYRGGQIVTERTAAHVGAFEIDGTRREGFSIGSSEHFALPRLRARALGADDIPVQTPLTDVGVYLGWLGGATWLAHYGTAVVAPLERLPPARRALDEVARRIQRSRAEPRQGEGIRADVVAVAADARGTKLASMHLTGGGPYSFTAPILSWAAGKAAAHGGPPPRAVRPGGGLRAGGPRPGRAAPGVPPP